MKTHITLTKYQSNQVSLDSRYIHVLEELAPESDGNIGPRTFIIYRMPEEALEYTVEESVEEIKVLVREMEHNNHQADLTHAQEIRRARFAKQD